MAHTRARARLLRLVAALAVATTAAQAFLLPSAGLRHAPSASSFSSSQRLHAAAATTAPPAAAPAATPAAEQQGEAARALAAAKERLRPAFEAVDARTQRVLKRVLTSFREHQVGTHMFAGVDGYGHGDVGRDTLEAIYADLFGAEAALVRVQMFSGTHAISCALYGVLRPGDAMLGISGRPYDTLEEVIGTRVPRPEYEPQEGEEEPAVPRRQLTGSLMEYGVSYDQVRTLTCLMIPLLFFNMDLLTPAPTQPYLYIQSRWT